MVSTLKGYKPQQMPGMPQQTGGGGGLPPSGLQMQLNSLREFYQGVQGSEFGFNPRTMGAQMGMPGGGVPEPQMGAGQVNIQQLARNLASRYGLSMGRGELVDAQGNFMMTPDQLAAASGGQMGMGEAAAKMNYISQAIANEQNRQQQRQGISALQTGAGLVQSRARGSLAALQSGYYRDIADMYANQEHEGADFSYFIEKEKMDIQQELYRRAEKMAKKKARFGFVGGLIGGIAGFATGNVGAGIAGVGGALDSASATGWF